MAGQTPNRRGFGFMLVARYSPSGHFARRSFWKRLVLKTRKRAVDPSARHSVNGASLSDARSTATPPWSRVMHVLEHQAMHTGVPVNLCFGQRLAFDLAKSQARRGRTRERAEVNHRNDWLGGFEQSHATDCNRFSDR